MAKLSPFPKELHYDSQKISSNISHRKDKEGSLHAPNQILNYDLILVKFEKNMLSLIIQDALFRVNFFNANFNQFDWMLKIFDQSKCVKIALTKIYVKFMLKIFLESSLASFSFISDKKPPKI